ncbi:MAG: stage V sporulation protein AD [Peptococcaceae bacterium]|nr:stage V sporulation protein AD [Peptococcaceae bacterium]
MEPEKKSNRRIGSRTLQFASPVAIKAWATVAGRKENEGKLTGQFDYVFEENRLGQKSWERAEQRLQQSALELALEKAGLSCHHLSYYMGGDLLNQIVATSYTARMTDVPYIGLYGACSSLAEGMIVGGCMLDGGYGERVAVCTSSHHDAAEQQLRYPTEMGVQRTLSAQWTVTGSGAYILEPGRGEWSILQTIPGKIVDRGISNSSDMGSAMAAAAIDTISCWIEDTGLLDDVDYIVTGDLGKIGYEICKKQLIQRGYAVDGKYFDCGMEIYHAEQQDVHAGGSGCGCSAVVLGAGFLPQMKADVENRKRGKTTCRLLYVGTGALLSPVTVQQGESIPGIAHGVLIEYCPANLQEV